jgi:oxygen-independent coproporphyrinogen-3 oxidase
LNNDPLGLYIHIPFCERKCPYCDFNTYAGLDSLYEDTVDALCAEMQRWGERLVDRQVTTIFLGGGTPTVLDAHLLDRIFAQVHRTFDIAVDAEITCEANPGTVDRSKFSTLRALGVNRLSMGVQSFQPDELSFLGRIHSVDDVLQAWDAARSADFDNVNLDFIFGLPDQKTGAWRQTLDQALSMQPEHLSLYSLIVEENTPLHNWVESGSVAAPDDDLAALHYEIAMECLDASGYEQYEVSNWVRPKRIVPHGRERKAPDGRKRANGTEASAEELMPTLACRHNLIYWRNQEYLGVGPGAHSHLQILTEDGQQVEKRWGNRRPVAGYVNRIRSGESVEAFSETISLNLSMGETMMLGLRLLKEGVSGSDFRYRYGVGLEETYAHQLDELMNWRLLEKTGERVRLTKRGLMVGNQVFLRFLPESAEDTE